MWNPRLLGVVGMLGYVLLMHALFTLPAGAQQVAQDKIEKVAVPALPPQPIGIAKPEGPKGEDELDYTDKVTLPHDRLAEKKVNEAKRLVGIEDWANAVRLLQNILDIKEDVFLKDEKGRWVSVRAEANRIVGGMPRDGQQFYEQQFGSEARRMLKAGLAAGEPQVYADVALRFMHTEAGAEAAIHLGTYHLDHGRYIVAALCYERLLAREGVLERLPALTLFKAAMAFERSGDVKNRDRVWAQFVQRHENGSDKMPAALRRQDAAQLKNALALKQGNRPASERFDWPMFLGSPDRAAVGEGGAPLLAPRYKFDMMRSSEVKEWLDKALTRHSSKAQSQLSGFHPIAVGGKLVFRSFWGVHAYNIKSGELEWEAPAGMSIDYIAKNKNRIDGTGQMNNWINMYLQNAPSIFYDNSTLGTLSTDNVRVYFVEDLAVPPHPSTIMMNRWQGNPPLSGEVQKWMEHNKLSAYDLSTGKLIWELGTGDPDQPFSGAFFLGPPLPLGEKLFVLAEMGSGEIRLLCIDPTGKGSLVWSQTLCLVERRIGENPSRRSQAAHLAYGDGVLVCPTNAGVILGVDLLTKSLLWAHSYQEGSTENQAKNVKQMQAMGGYPTVPVTPPTWASSAPIVRDSQVVFTAPDGESVRCLNLRDGSLVWREPRQNDLYLAGVFGERVVLVGRELCRALSVKDGKEQWKCATGLPSGRGVANGKEYFLPLKSGEVWTIDLAKGEIRAKSRSTRVGDSTPPIVPGNLIFHDGDVISQSATAVAAYPQLAVKESAITQLLLKNPKDPRGLAERGDLRLNRGDLVGAVADLREALQQKEAPAEVLRLARDRLYEALGDLLQRDFAGNEQHLKEFEQLATIAIGMNETPEARTRREEEERDRKARLLRTIAKGREEQGRLKEAMQAYLEFGKLGRKELLTIPEDPATRALPEVWIQGRISELIRRAKPEQRTALNEAFEEQWVAAQKAGTLESLENYAALFGPLCVQGQRAKLLLAERLLEEKQYEQAQVKLWALAKQSDAAVAALALDALARLNTRLGELENAAFYYRLLAQKYPKVTIRDGKTAEEIYLDLATDKRFLPYLEEPRRGWTTLGPGESFKTEAPFGQFPFAQSYWLEPEGELPPFFRRFRLAIDVNAYSLKMVDAVSNVNRGGFQLLGVLRPNYYGSVTKFRPSFRVSGGLIIFMWGPNIYAVDPSKPRERLWSCSVLGDYDPGTPNQNGMMAQLVLNQNGQPEIYYPDGFRERLGTLGPADASYVTFLSKDEGLVAVDPGKADDKKRPVKRWVKSDVPIGTEMFGDSEFLYLVLPGRNEAPGRSLALRAIDGAPVEVPDFAALYQRKHRVVGRKLLLKDVDAKSGAAKLRLYDVHTGKDMWTHDLDAQAVLLNSFADEFTGFVDSKGKLMVLELESGKNLLAADLDANVLKNTPEIHLLRDANQLFVVFNNPPDNNPNQKERRTIYNQGLQLRSILANGPMYAFDRATGKERWRREIPPQALILDQFDEMPIALFASMQIVVVQVANAGQQPFQRNQNVVLAIDKRDGLDGAGGVAKGGKDEVYKEESTSRGGTFHSMKIDPRVGLIELFGGNYKVSFRVTSETVKAAGEGRALPTAQTPVEPPRPVGLPGIPVPGQIRQQLRQQQIEEILQLQMEAEARVRAIQEAEAARRLELERQRNRPPEKK